MAGWQTRQGSTRRAEHATRAFFETLALRLGNHEARHLASQLPVELQDCLAPTQPDVEKLSPDEFFSRFADKAGVNPGEARQTARTVWDEVRQTVTADEVSDVKSQLPNELTVLFE